MKKRATITAMIFAALVMVSTVFGEIIFVDFESPGRNDGSSWEDAFNDLQDALFVARYGDEIWVAEGIYTPMGPLTPTLPGQAVNPNPADGATGCDRYITLFWSAGAGAVSHDVYLGTAIPGTFQGNQINTFFSYQSLLDSNTTYYWRIDEVNYWGKTTGLVWSFTTGEEQTPEPPIPPPIIPPPTYLPIDLYNSRDAEVSSDDPTATFQLINGVTIKGGYAGYSEPDPDIRDIQEYKTVLCGDLNGDDGPDFANIEDNSRHVVTGSGTDETAILDGFTIAGGHATSPNRYGGGMYNEQGSPTVLNCTFRENSAYSSGGGMYNWQASPALINCIFIGNSAGFNGGGVCNFYDSSPKISHCIFCDNIAGFEGGGIFTSSSIKLTECTFSRNSASRGGGINVLAVDTRDPELTNCTFNNNSAEYGGAILCQGPSYPAPGIGFIPENSPLLTNCIINGNFADEGGGIFNNAANPMITNCLFSINSAESGGGIQNEGGRPTMTNCTFSSNRADYGSGIYNYWGISTLANCILWDGGEEIWSNNDSTISITYSDVQGGWPGEGNIVDDPLFVEPAAGDYHLLPGSPCIDTGDPNFVPVLGEIDIDGEPRVMGGRVDMGIDEVTEELTPILRIWPTEFQFHLYADIHDSNSQVLKIRNTGSGTMNWRISENCGWLQVHPKHGISIGDTNEVNITVDISRLQPGEYNYELRITANKAVNSPVMVPVTLYVYESSKLYVPSEYTTIQEAIDGAYNGATIIVSKGTYTGDGNRDIDFHGKAITVRSTDPNDPNTVAATIIDCKGTSEDTHRGFYFQTGEGVDSVLAGFTIRNGYVLYYGGGIRCEASSPTIKNCILRDNIAQYYYGYAPPSGPTPESISAMVNEDKEIQINCPPPLPGWRGRGGGIYCFDSNATLQNCQFINNSAHQYGGGMYNNNSSPTLSNCIFSGNSSDSGGGIECHSGSNPTLINCTFVVNTAVYGGGGMRNSSSNPSLTNCVFIDNYAGWSGGMGNYHSSPTLNNCTFSGNRADTDGGGMNNGTLCTPTLTNCTFSGNSAVNGGGMYISQDSSTLINCVFTENSANAGGGMYNSASSLTLSKCKFSGNLAKYGGGIVNYHSDLMLLSCVFSGNYSYEHGGGIHNTFSDLTVANCTLTGNSAGIEGGGIYMYVLPPQPPLVPDGANADVPFYNMCVITNCILWENFPEQIVNYGLDISVTYSDVQGGWPGEGNINTDPCFVEPGYWDANGVWVDGDYHLFAGSPCIDAGMDAGVYEDMDGNIRPFDYPGVDNNGDLPDFDMGAYETVLNVQSRLTILPRTINYTGRGQKILAVMRLPENVVKDDIDLYEKLVLYPGGIPATAQKVVPISTQAQSNIRIYAVFDKAEIFNAVNNYGDVELTVVGRFTSGDYFYGKDTVRIISGRTGYRILSKIKSM